MKMMGINEEQKVGKRREQAWFQDVDHFCTQQYPGENKAKKEPLEISIHNEIKDKRVGWA